MRLMTEDSEDRFVVRLDPTVARMFSQIVKKEGFSNKSEAVRQLIRARYQELFPDEE